MGLSEWMKGVLDAESGGGVISGEVVKEEESVVGTEQAVSIAVALQEEKTVSCFRCSRALRTGGHVDGKVKCCGECGRRL